MYRIRLLRSQWTTWTTSNSHASLKKTSLTLVVDAMVVLVHHHAVAVILPQTAATMDVEMGLLVGIALVDAMTIVVAHLPVTMITTLVIVATDLLLAADPEVLLWMSPTLLLAVDILRIDTDLLLAGDTTMATVRTGTNVLELARHLEGMVVDMMSVHATGDRLFRACHSSA